MARFRQDTPTPGTPQPSRIVGSWIEPSRTYQTSTVAQAAQPVVSRVANPRASELNGTLVGKQSARRLAVGETADRLSALQIQHAADHCLTAAAATPA